MRTFITELLLILQKPVDPMRLGLPAYLEPDIQSESPRPFGTEGTDPGTKKIVRLAGDLLAENTSISIPVTIQLGPGASELAKRAILRALAAHVDEDPDWEYFYAIAKLGRTDGEEFFRTIVPRTQITIRIRNLRHRKRGRRK